MTNAREQIIAATCDLLEVQGYHATGLNQIIKESGSPKGSLYYYFPGGKEELTAEALNHVGNLVRQRIRANLSEVADPVEAIRRFLLNIARNVEASGYRAGGPITTVAMETASTNDRLRETCDRIYGEWQAAFAEKLAASGYESARAARLASLILASIEGAIILCRVQQRPEPLQMLADEIAFLLTQARA